MGRLAHFFQYHNAIPIAVSVLLLGAGGVYAATNPEAIYSSQVEVLSIDNTYIATKDLSAWTPRTEITSVTEDDEYYYVTYIFSTIDLADSVWRDVTKLETMKVSKRDLGPYRDLGLYVTEQLSQVIDHEKSRLVETQEIEKKVVSQKVVATMYGGLIGKLLDDTTETLPGYTPVVAPPPAETQVASAAAPDSPSDASPSTLPPPPAASGSITIQVLGNNPAHIPLGSSYVDLGAVITGPTVADRNLGIELFVDDVEVTQVQIDTSAVGTHIIVYKVEAPDGRFGSAERTVEIYDPNEQVRDTATTTSESSIASTTPQTDSEAAEAEATTATTTP